MLKKLFPSFTASRFLFFAATIVLIGVRFIWLDKFPPGLNHDEADVILSAKNYFINGSDISGVKFPLSLFGSKTEAGLSGLPSVLLAPFFIYAKLTLFNARFFYVLINIITAVFISKIIYLLSKKKLLSQVSLFVFLINPLSFYYSRAVTEAPFALLFTMVGVYFFFKESIKQNLLSILFFIFAFYSYFGAKPVVPVLVILLLFVHWLIRKNSTKQYFAYLVVFLTLIASYFILAPLTPNNTLKSRSSEVSVLNIARFERVVDEKRRASVDFSYKNVFFNKYSEMFKEIGYKYTGWISKDYLFFKGDPRATYAFSEHGAMYLFDLLFIFIGIYGLCLLGKKGRELAIVTSVLFLCAPIGSALSSVEDSYIFRSFLLIPGFVILISVGIYTLIKWSGKKGKYLTTSLVLLVYFGSFVNFLVFYFARYPVKMQEATFFEQRILSNYLVRSQKLNKKIYVVSRSPLQMYQQYLFFSNSLSKMAQTDSNTKLTNNIYFVNNCNTVDDGIIIVDRLVECNMVDGGFVVIQNQKDSGTEFKIYNDFLCNGVMMTNYRRMHYLSDYSVEKMDDISFCNRWINEI